MAPPRRPAGPPPGATQAASPCPICRADAGCYWADTGTHLLCANVRFSGDLPEAAARAGLWAHDLTRRCDCGREHEGLGPARGYGFLAQRASDLEAEVFPPLRTLVDRLFYEGSTLLVGSPKSGKSLTMLGIACAVALGGRALGTLAVQQCEVLYLTLEDGKRRVQRRLRKIMNGSPFPPGLHLVYKMARPLGQGFIDGIVAYLDAAPAIGLVIIDTLAHVRPRVDGGKRVDVFQQQYAEIVDLTDLAQGRRVGVVILHHTRKERSEDAMDMVNATQGLAAAADCVIVLQRHRLTQEAVLSIMGRDLDEEYEMGLRWDPTLAGYVCVGDAAEVAKSKERHTVRAALKRTDGPSGLAELRDLTQYAYGPLRKLLSDMVAEGEIVRVERGLYAMPDAGNLAREGNMGNKVTNGPFSSGGGAGELLPESPISGNNGAFGVTNGRADVTEVTDVTGGQSNKNPGVYQREDGTIPANVTDVTSRAGARVREALPEGPCPSCGKHWSWKTDDVPGGYRCGWCGQAYGAPKRG